MMELEREKARKIRAIEQEAEFNAQKLKSLLLESQTTEIVIHGHRVTSATSQVSIEDPLPYNDSTVRQSQTPNRTSHAAQDAADIIRACMALPARPLPKFDGSPNQYFGFIRGFQSTVARYTEDPADRLAYLIQCCEGPAHQAIKRCTVLSPKQGYEEAFRILERRFGQPHVIAYECLDEVARGPLIRSNDHLALARLADEMKLCSATLTQLGYEAELNTRANLRAVIRRLPYDLQSKWGDYAAKRLESCLEPSFDDLTKIVAKQADSIAARQIYMSEPKMNEYRPNERKSPLHPSGASRAGTIMATQTRGTDGGMRAERTCPKCAGPHYLDQCQAFQASTLEERWADVREQQLCFLCLKPNHTSKTCRSRRSCGFNQCTRPHHPLLHINSTAKSTAALTGHLNQTDMVSEINQASSSMGCSVSFPILPVKVRGPRGMAQVYAMLDNGSDTTLIDHKLAERLGLMGSSRSVTMKTLAGVQSMDTKMVSFSIESMDATELLEVAGAWAVGCLPQTRRFVPTKTEMQRWQHLEDVPIWSIPKGQVALLIGCDVPKAHWTLEQRVGAPNDPYAVRGPLGWTIVGPVKPRGMVPNNQINSHYLTKDHVNASLEKMSEKEREEELFKGAERRDAIQARRALKQRLKEKRDRERAEKASKLASIDVSKQKKQFNYANAFTSDSEEAPNSDSSDLAGPRGLHQRKLALEKKKEAHSHKIQGLIESRRQQAAKKRRMQSGPDEGPELTIQSIVRSSAASSLSDSDTEEKPRKAGGERHQHGASMSQRIFSDASDSTNCSRPGAPPQTRRVRMSSSSGSHRSNSSSDDDAWSWKSNLS